MEFIDLAKPKAVLGAATVAPAGQVPITFDLIVDSSKLSKAEVYAIQARIEVGGSTWFASPEPTPVDLAKTGAPFSILLVQAGGKSAQEAAGASLAGTQWRILGLDGKSTDPNVMSTLVFDADSAVKGNAGCNTFRGYFDIEGTMMNWSAGVDNDGLRRGQVRSRGTLPRSARTDGVLYDPRWRTDAYRCGR